MDLTNDNKDDERRSNESGKARHVMRTRVLRRPIVFLRVRCSICVRCSIPILLIKTVHYSISHCTCTTKFNIKNFYVLPTKCFCVSYIDYANSGFATVQVRSSFLRDVMARTWLVPSVSRQGDGLTFKVGPSLEDETTTLSRNVSHNRSTFQTQWHLTQRLPPYTVINRLLFVTETECVHWAVRTKSWNK